MAPKCRWNQTLPAWAVMHLLQEPQSQYCHQNALQTTMIEATIQSNLTISNSNSSSSIIIIIQQHSTTNTTTNTTMTTIIPITNLIVAQKIMATIRVTITIIRITIADATVLLLLLLLLQREVMRDAHQVPPVTDGRQRALLPQHPHDERVQTIHLHHSIIAIDDPATTTGSMTRMPTIIRPRFCKDQDAYLNKASDPTIHVKILAATATSPPPIILCTLYLNQRMPSPAQKAQMKSLLFKRT